MKTKSYPDRRERKVQLNLALTEAKKILIKEAAERDGRSLKGFCVYHLTRVIEELGLQNEAR
jgi:uncharacterized protein (DUF1778 family)